MACSFLINLLDTGKPPKKLQLIHFSTGSCINNLLSAEQENESC